MDVSFWSQYEKKIIIKIAFWVFSCNAQSFIIMKLHDNIDWLTHQTKIRT